MGSAISQGGVGEHEEGEALLEELLEELRGGAFEEPLAEPLWDPSEELLGESLEEV
jgi:hypothetical protein